LGVHHRADHDLLCSGCAHITCRTGTDIKWILRGSAVLAVVILPAKKFNAEAVFLVGYQRHLDFRLWPVDAGVSGISLFRHLPAC
jgi:hypothetical protein